MLFSGTSGLILLLGAFALDTWLGVHPWLLMGTGGGLLMFAAGLLWLLTQPRYLRGGAWAVAAADAGWVAAAAGLLAAYPSLLTSAGQLALGAVTVVVAMFAVAQVIGIRRLGSTSITGAIPFVLRVERVLMSPPEEVWNAIADAGDYARFAPGIASTSIVSGNGEGMTRACTDDHGGTWTETCTLWEEGTCYRMSVDVDSYPLYYRLLLHEFAQTWLIDRAPGHTRVTLTFEGATRLGILGLLIVKVLGNRRRLESILEAYEQDLVTVRRVR
jgi:uncharacterized protein YndB with AHSA1/START domain